jgi:PIN domain nuclease of toxin-antitoxin system
MAIRRLKQVPNLLATHPYVVLPDIHKDLFDRMLIAKVIIERLTLVTRDKSIAEYDIDILTA